MSAADTRDYLAHRLRAAGATPDLVRFSDGASRAVFKFSGGLPRLVNAVADRALLIGYNLNARQIDAVMTRQAIGEVSPAETRRYRRQNRLLALLLAFAVLICGVVFAALSLAPAKPPQQTVAGSSAAQTILLQHILQRLQEHNSSQESYRAIVKAWQIPSASHDLAKNTLETALKQAGLDLFRYSGNLGSLARMGYPAILELTPVNGQKRYLVFGGLTPDQALVATETGDLVEVSTAALEQVWTGKAIIPWKNVLRLSVPVPYLKDSTERTMLAHLLSSAGLLKSNPQSTVTETTVREAVQTFQHLHGIEAAGVAGGQTLLLLYQQSGEFRAPSMKKSEKTTP
jgi:general secretion pathway protein A